MMPGAGGWVFSDPLPVSWLFEVSWPMAGGGEPTSEDICWRAPVTPNRVAGGEQRQWRTTRRTYDARTAYGGSMTTQCHPHPRTTSGSSVLLRRLRAAPPTPPTPPTPHTTLSTFPQTSTSRFRFLVEVASLRLPKMGCKFECKLYYQGANLLIRLTLDISLHSQSITRPLANLES